MSNAEIALGALRRVSLLIRGFGTLWARTRLTEAAVTSVENNGERLNAAVSFDDFLHFTVGYVLPDELHIRHHYVLGKNRMKTETL